MTAKLLGFGLGFLAGGAAGAAIGNATEPDCSSDDFLCLKGLQTGVGGLAGALIGGVIGLIVAPGEKWTAVDPHHVQLSLIAGARSPVQRGRQ